MGIAQILNDPLCFFNNSGKGEDILVITGWRGVGKTIFCQKAINNCRNAGLNVAGLLSPGRFNNSQKTGIQAVNLSSGEKRLAASGIMGEIQGFQLGKWTFNEDIFEWGNQVLSSIASTDILVIDELGFLEFNLSTGWTSGFEVLHSKIFGKALVVIRPECIDAFSKMNYKFSILEITAPRQPADRS